MKILSNFNKLSIKTNRFYSKINLKPPWDVLFFGTDKFSLASLKALHAEQRLNNKTIRNLEVVTTAKNSYVKKYALENALKVQHWPLDIDSLKGCFHIGLVVSFGQLIPKNVIESFPMGMINVHASLLPRWRGAAPIIHALAAGDEKTGVTIMNIHPHKFDIGEIIHQQEVEISKDIRMPELHDLLAIIGANNLINVLKNSPEMLNNAIGQDATKATLAPRVHSSMADIDFSQQTCKDLYNLSRALTGLYPLVGTLNEKLIKIHNIVNYSHVKGDYHQIGKIEFNKLGKVLTIGAKDGWILVDKISLPGKKIMTATEFSNGYLKNKQLFIQSVSDTNKNTTR